jgi:replicative DNA helicase
MIEQSIIKVFIDDNELYDKYYPSLKLEYVRQNYPILYKCFQCLPVTSFDGLESAYLANYPVLKEGDRYAVRTVIEGIEKSGASADEITPYLESHLAQAWASEVALVALEVGEGRKTVEQLDEVISTRDSSLLLEEELIDYVSTDIEELVKNEVIEGGLHWRLNCLNRSLGPLRKGNFGHIFARVNTGKTALWISELTHMAQQTDKPILIFFNEEQGIDVVYRMYNAITGLTYLELKSDPRGAKKIWDAKLGDKIKFIDDPSMVNKKTMEKLCALHEPALILIDNMDKVKGFSGDRKDLLLHEIYKWGRDLAKTYCPVITIGQADATGKNSKVIDDSQMADSKTAKPSEMDFIIGIGREDKEGYENMRYLTVSKNKLRGDENTQEDMRHMRGHPVLLKTQYSIYEDM